MFAEVGKSFDPMNVSFHHKLENEKQLEIGNNCNQNINEMAERVAIISLTL